MGGGLGDLISKLPGLSPGGGMPGLPTPPSAGTKPTVPGIPPIPPSLRPPVVAKPPVVPPTVSLPPINPNIPGGGARSINRGSDPRFNTPTGQAPPTNGGFYGRHEPDARARAGRSGARAGRPADGCPARLGRAAAVWRRQRADLQADAAGHGAGRAGLRDVVCRWLSVSDGDHRARAKAVSASPDQRPDGGGRSPTLADVDFQPERARFLRNFSLQEPGALQPYPGWQTRSNGSISGRADAGRAADYLVGGTFLLASVNGVIFKPNDNGVWNAGIVGGRSGVNEHYYVYDRNLVALFDGQAAPLKSKDGTTWTQMGITAPAAAPTLALVAGGTLVAANTYEVGFTYGDTSLSFESSASAVASIAPTAGNNTIRVTMPASADPQVTTKYIYCRNVTAGESVLRRAGSVPNATATFDITTPSSFFPDGVEMPTKNTPPVRSASASSGATAGGRATRRSRTGSGSRRSSCRRRGRASTTSTFRSNAATASRR